MTNYRQLAYDRYAQPVAIDYAKYADSYRRRLAHRLFLTPQTRCLDIACGYGNFLAYLRAAGVTDFTGVDATPAAVTVTQREFGAEHANCADAFEFLRHPAKKFNLISALDFVEHVTKPELFELLGSIHAALEPGGLFLLRTPNANGLFGMAARYNDITHEICFTPGALADTLARCGFKTLAIWEDTGTPGSPLQAAHWLAWQAVRLAIRCINAAETGSWDDGVLTRNLWALAVAET